MILTKTKIPKNTTIDGREVITYVSNEEDSKGDLFWFFNIHMELNEDDFEPIAEKQDELYVNDIDWQRVDDFDICSVHDSVYDKYLEKLDDICTIVFCNTFCDYEVNYEHTRWDSYVHFRCIAEDVKEVKKVLKFHNLY